ncbi:MAG TPA: fluoride efflux transporter CrcB [Longimicrobiales bacterium]|nr:fluoride efflux transporter CrcB [Longimicrobiales bacterium]
MTLLYIAIGGAAGAVARYGLGGWVQERGGFGFPWGTLAVNVFGSLLVGFTLRWLEAAPFGPDVRALLVVGVLGAFTTFSTFSYETVALLQDGAWGRAAGYAFGSVALGIAAVWAGLLLAAPFLHARA